MASLYKRGKIYWIEYRDNGIRKQISTGQTDKRIAENIRKFYDSQENLSYLRGTKLYEINFIEFIDEYCNMRQCLVSKKTLQKDKIALRSLAKFVPKHYNLSDINTNIIQKWYLQKIKETTATTANSLLRHLKKFFNAAVKSCYISQNPCQFLEKARENESEIKTLQKSEIRQLLDQLRPQKEYYQIAMIAINTGLRVSELCNLKVSDISIENSTITVRSENDRPTKSRKFRIVPIPQHALRFFESLVKYRPPNEFLLYNSSNQVWRPDWLSKKFARVARQAGIDCGLHDLRRAYGAWLVMSGCDLVTVQENMGHSSVHVTVKHYAHLLLEQRLTQTDKLPDFDVGKL